MSSFPSPIAIRPHLAIKWWRSLANYLFLCAWQRSKWELHGHTIEDLGDNIARFAIQSLAIMVRRNPPVRIRGSVPYLGSRVVVYWQYFIALVSCIVSVHFALFAVTVFWVTKVANDFGGDLRNESQVGILGQAHMGETE